MKRGANYIYLQIYLHYFLDNPCYSLILYLNARIGVDDQIELRQPRGGIRPTA